MPSLDALQTAHVSTWRAISEEPRGKREKRWVQGAGAEWLRKEPRELRPTEPVVETLTLRLARAAGLQAAESQLATWLDDEKTAKYGIIVRRFLDTNFETLIEGIQLLGEDPVYNPEAHGEHTLERVRAAVAKREAAPGQLLQSLSDVLLFDAWIGNSDRHQQNWGLVKDFHGAFRLAPIYDTAACLGVELPSAHPLFSAKPEDKIFQKYIQLCGSGFGDGGKRLLSQVKLVESLRAWPEWASSRERLLPAFRGLLSGPVSDYLAKIVRQEMPTERLDFLPRLLEARLKWLENL